MMSDAQVLEPPHSGDAYRLAPAQVAWALAAPCARRLVLEFDAPLDRERLKHALIAAGRAYEALRTRFAPRSGLTLPVQEIDPAQPLWLEAVALDARNGPVVEATLVGETQLHLRALALALDRRSLALWAQAILAAYAGKALGDTIQPADAAEGLAAMADDAGFAAARDFWRKTLAEAEPPGRLPEESPVSAGVCAALERRWSDDMGPLSTAAALALWSRWLAIEAGLSSATIGVEMSGRDADLADSVGNYARSVACAFPADPADDVLAATARAAEWLERAEDWMLATPDPEGPATERVGALTVFAYEFADRRDDPAFGVSAHWSEEPELPCRLRLVLIPGGFRLVHDAGRFSSLAAARAADRFSSFVVAALADARRPLSRIPRVPPDMAADILRRGWGDALPSVAASGVLDLIAAAVAAGADRRALTDSAGSCSYAAFWDAAGRIAATLAAAGVGRGARVALIAPRSAATIAALIGVLRAGAIAVPIDPAYPATRQTMLIEDVGADAILAAADCAEGLGAAPRGLLTIEAALADARGASFCAPTPDGDDGAYIIHTSGSTGRPKGVVVSHANLLASTLARRAYYGREPRRFLLTPSLSFDSSVAGLYWTLATGGEVLLPDAGAERDPGALTAVIAKAGVTHWLTVPALYQAVLTAAAGEELASLTDAIVAGEACPPTLVAAHAAKAPWARLHNEYGPTEATVWCSCWSWTGGPTPDAAPIGRPIPGAAIYLLDELGELVPFGAPGEIHVAGAGVARGYLGQPFATARAFRADPFAATPGARSYATGDVARWGPDGELLYLGRIDRQIKIGGRRIEPGEIETVLNAMPGVARAVALRRQDRLIAYLERRPGATIDAAGARARLAEALPEWLVPDAVVALDAFPLGPNGKLDVDALPAPERASRASYRAPATPAEAALADAVAAKIGVAEPGMDDDFFSLGGDSLMALQVAAQLRTAGFALSVRSIFATPHLGALAELMQPVVAVPGTASDEAPAPLTPIQRWFVARRLPDAGHYNQALAFDVGEKLVLERLETALNRLAAHHPALRSIVEPFEGGWRQRPLAGAPPAPGWFDLRALPAALRDRVFAQKLSELQHGLAPFAGQMLRVGAFQLGADRPDALIIVAHHLIIDARSWPVLIEDLTAAYFGRPLAPALSFGAYARTLAARAGQDDSAERRAWRDYLAGAVGRLPRDFGTGENCEADAAELTLTLADAETRALARWGDGRAGRKASDAVLAALALALGEWIGHDKILIDVEGSGRDMPADMPDPSRTVGWLTTLAPLALPHRPDDALEARLRAAVAAIDAAPAGWTYALDAADGPNSGAEFCVNFFGGMAVDAGAGDWLRPSPIDVGAARGADNPRAHLIDLEVEVGSAGLSLLWRFPTTLYENATIRRLAARHIDLLTQIASARP